MKHPLVALALAFGLGAADAGAATYYVATDGSDANNGSSGSPFRWPQKCVDVMTAGDTCIVRPGTYGNSITIDSGNASGTPGNPITLRAENYVVACADAASDPDGCEVNRSNITTLSGSFNIGNNGGGISYWGIEGFRKTSSRIYCDGGGGAAPNHINVRFVEFDTASDDSMWFQYCTNSSLEYSFCHRTEPSNGDYCVPIYYTSNITVRHLYCAGNYNHCISLKRANTNTTLERIVCEGQNSECIFLGQNQDDSGSFSGGTSCSNRPRDDGTTGTLYDSTSVGATVRHVFARHTANYLSRYTIRLANIRDADVQHVFSYPSGAFSSGLFHDLAPQGSPEGECGIEPGNNSIRGMIIVGTDLETSCVRIRGNGFSPSTLTIENLVCHDPQGGADDAVNLAGGVNNSAGAWESTEPPVTTYRNFVHNDCAGSFTSTTNLTQQSGAAFSCGSPPNGARTDDPAFKGPESVPVPTLDVSDGRKLWDWAGTYQPIVDRFDVTNANYKDAGTGSAEPCNGAACDIGPNEFFVPETLWASCAVIGDRQPVHDPIYVTPWIPGRPGLVIDVDCAQKRIVIGRCADPLDEATCDSDVYIHKSAFLRKRRTNAPVALSSGTSGSDQDASGICWRSRAVLDFNEALEELTGIWVRYELDPDGGTHDCTCSGADCPKFAWQGMD